MKKILYVFLIIIFSSTSIFSQEKNVIPPGTIQINDSVFIDKMPVTNLTFLEYLTAKDFLRKKGFTSFEDYSQKLGGEVKKLTYLYPTFLKNLPSPGSFLATKKYFENSKYSNSPVLSISKQQAQDFCRWRSEMVNYLWHVKKPIDFPPIQYRLPSIEELNTAQEYFTGLKKYKYYDGKNPTKFKRFAKPSGFLRYNISEYTSSSELFGENWKSEAPTQFPNDVTGFRCICEITE